MRTDTPKTIYLKDYQPPSYLIESVDLEFTLSEDHTIVNAVLEVRKQTDSPLVLDGKELELLSVSINEIPLSEDQYCVEDDSLTIFQCPDDFGLRIETRIYPGKNLSLEGLYQSSGNFCTQCEAQGFRKITYYPDRPDVMATFRVKIIADRDLYPVLLSNGNKVNTGTLDNNLHWVEWHDPYKKPCYLFALVAGKLEYIEDKFTTMTGREVCLQIYVEPENINKCDHAMQSLKKAMLWDEQKYGLAYDLDIYMIVAVNDFNMGAMENKGLNVFNSKYVLASPETATDDDYDGIESVIAHEYFHNWTGNRVTCRDWFQLSLKEGLTVFRDQEFSCDMTSRTVKRIQDVRVLRSHQFAEDAGPMSHPVRPSSYVEINNFYTVTIYNKGAEVVRMYQSLFGVEGFRRGMDLYFSRHDGQAVTTDDFCTAMADANHADLTQFRRWYDQEGTPIVDITDHYDSTTRQYTIEMKQHCPSQKGQDDKLPFYIPVICSLYDAESGQLLSVKSDSEFTVNAKNEMVLILDAPSKIFVFNEIKNKPAASLLQGFSAPVVVNYAYNDEHLAFLIKHDNDEFNRWEAGQTLLLNTLQEYIDGKGNNELNISHTLIDALKSLLMDKMLDKGLIAEIICLPSENYLAELQKSVVDVTLIHTALDLLKTKLAQILKQEFTDTYEQHSQVVSYSFDSESVSARRLKNVALSYLMTLNDPAINELCVKQYQNASNMTDSMAALGCITDSQIPNKHAFLDDFYQKWKDDTLVLDKWFGLQARSTSEDTFERVQELMSHIAFSINNPNKVRALIGSFAMGNPVCFHREDGAGYQFLADQIIRLDDINPQVAARMLHAFTRWKRYDPARQLLMKKQLERVIQHEGLSSDCYEIGSRTLG